MADGHGQQGPMARRGTPGDGRATRPDEFDVIVASLVEDREWRRSVRRTRWRHRWSLLGSWMLRGFSELGCWFTAMPTQRCAAQAAARRAARP